MKEKDGITIEKLLKLIAYLTNYLHDLFISLFSAFGFQLNDKQLHFIIVAAIGMIIYIITNKLFKVLVKLNIAVISFIYTFTVLVVFVFAIEIEQKITNRGTMDFSDIVAGLWGFVIIFAAYLLFVGLFNFIKILLKKSRNTE
jgi:ABC-type amino acid transport system permease subunit